VSQQAGLAVQIDYQGHLAWVSAMVLCRWDYECALRSKKFKQQKVYERSCKASTSLGLLAAAAASGTKLAVQHGRRAISHLNGDRDRSIS